MSKWGKSNILNYYLYNRSSLRDLYKSEVSLLKKINKKKVKTILDFGCAAGNFYNIFSLFFKKKIKYIGIDYEKKFIKIANKKYWDNRNVSFFAQKGQKLKFKENSASFVFCTSVLHHIYNYKKIINELIRVSSNYIFIDSPRVHFEKNIVANMDLSKRFRSNIKSNTVNYYVVNLEHYLNFLNLTFRKKKIIVAIFFCEELPYSKKYLNLNKKIMYLTMLLFKGKMSNKKFTYTLNTKNKKVINIFRKVFG